MSNAYGNFTITLPTTGQVAWDGPLNTALQAIADVLDTAIGVDGLNINGSLDAQGNLLINVKGLSFTSADDPAAARNIWWGVNGELYVRDGANNSIQVTSGGALNISLNGGIGGDYVGSSAQVVYSSAGAIYTFTSAPGVAAAMDMGDIHLRQGSVTNYVALKAPANLAGNINLTFPGALPSTKAVVLVDATGTLLFDTSYVGLSASVYLDLQAGHSSSTTNTAGYLQSAYAATGSQQGWWLTGGNTAAQFGVPLVAGSRVVSLKMNMTPTGGVSRVTGTLFARTDQGVMLPVARKMFLLSVGQNALTFDGTGLDYGSLPQILSNSGSYLLRVETGVSSVGAYLWTTKVNFEQATGSL